MKCANCELLFAEHELDDDGLCDDCVSVLVYDDEPQYN